MIDNKTYFIKFLVFLLFVQIQIFAQRQNYKFDRFATHDGFSGRFVNAIFQDSKGFIWIGSSNGLSRFDGISFKTYIFDSKDSTSIPGNEIKAFAEDKNGNLWIMTNQSFCLFNRKEDSFIRKKFRKRNKENIPHLISCYIDTKGFMWACSMKGLYRFELSDENIKNQIVDNEIYSLDEPDIKDDKTNVFSFAEDKNGKLWISSFSKTLFCFNEASNTFMPYAVNHPESESFSKKAKRMLFDTDGDLAIIIEHAGLLVWDRKKDSFELFKNGAENNNFEENSLYAITVGPDSLLWMGSNGEGGISIFNKRKRVFTSIKNQEMDLFSLGSDKINCFYRDRSNNLWIGLNNQINKFSTVKQKFTRYPVAQGSNKDAQFANTLCFVESKTGELWIGTDGGGLSRYNPKTGTYKHYRHIAGDKRSLSSNTIISLCEDREGTLWIGTFNGGLCRFKNEAFTTFMPNEKNPHSNSYHHNWYVFEDSKQNLWVATLSNGLQLFDRKTEKFYHYKYNPDDKKSLVNNALIQIFEDSKHNIYFTTYNGISYFNLNDYNFSKLPVEIKFKTLKHKPDTNSLSSNGIYCMAEDKENNLWFGHMSTGLDKYDAKTGKFTNYSIKEGLPGNFVYSILFDNNNNLWLTTHKGLARFNPKTEEIKLYDFEDGLQNKVFHGWSYKTSKGEMFISGPEGFNSFYPDKIKYNSNPPPVYITGFKLFNIPVKTNQKIKDREILKHDISETSHLVLTYKEDFFSLEFVALDYNSPVKNQYAYKLEGFNKDWIYCGNAREASYTNLDPGEYTFRVKASNNDGIWNETGAVLKITILPPWWGTLWFRALAGFAVIFIIVSIYYLKLTLYKKQQVRLTELVKIRTAELEKTNRYLTEQQVKIEEQSRELRIHAENLKEVNTILLENQHLIQEQTHELKEKNNQLSVLNATRDKLISIIGHDLRNPFNAILGFSNILLERFSSLSPEKSLKYISYIKDSAVASNNLLENLLNWSRTQSGNIIYEPKKLILKDILKDNIKLLSGSAQQKNIQIELSVNGEKILADENMIQTVFRNIISNAIKFTGIGGSIHISSKPLDKMIEVSIADTGVGIPEDVLRKLFQPSVQISTRGTSNESGTGLGLLICKEFIEKNGGSIRFESEVDKGTVFYFTVPKG